MQNNSECCNNNCNQGRNCPLRAATPAAAPGKLDDDMQMRCRKCGEQVTIEFNSARIVTHNPHTGKPRDALTQAELLELRRAADDFDEGCDTDVEHDLLARGALAGYLHCERFVVLDGFALDAAIAAAKGN